MLYVVAIHDVTKLRCRADLLAGRLVGDVIAIGKIGRIDHMDMAIDLRLSENGHVCRSDDVDAQSAGACTPTAYFRIFLPSRANASDAARWGIWNPILSSHPECAGRQNRLPACRCCRSPPIPGHDRTEPWKLDAT